MISGHFYLSHFLVCTASATFSATIAAVKGFPDFPADITGRTQEKN
jgi:hypothetical protein